MELDSRFGSGATKNDKENQEELSINLYKSVPYGQLTLEECEDLFRQRLEALHMIETARASEGQSRSLDILNMLRSIKSYVYKTNCLIMKKNDKQTQRLDQFSHMLLRMFCVYRADLWSWFKMNEKKLFLYRLIDQAGCYSAAKLEIILKSFHFYFEKVSGHELSELLQEKLIKNSNDIYKVRFTDALRFVANRSVALKDGFAILSKNDIISVAADAFERHLESQLAYARQHLKMEVFQVKQLLDAMNLVYQDHQDDIEERNRAKRREQGDGNKRPFAIEIEELENIVENHYPPCMRYLHETLMTDHHLKHLGRLYYGAFLRSGQVDLDSAIEFWRKEFTKKIPNDKFEREYKYNIRHLYGKEGSNKNGLSCFSCDKIISNPPGTSEKHGCPFKHFDEPHLRTMLTKRGLKDVDIDSIIMKKNLADPKAACTTYFELSRGCELPDTIRNPIQYYYESQRIATRTSNLSEAPEKQDLQQIVIDPTVNHDPEAEFDD